MESSRILVEKTQRCPYCHEAVLLEGDWLACRQCLARHHAACWREANRCAACQGETALVTGSSTPLQGDLTAELRRETQRTALEATRKDEKTASFLLGLATLGVHSFVDAIASFAVHAQDGDDQGDLLLRVERARTRAAQADSGRRVLRVIVPLLLLAPVVSLWALSAIEVGGAWLVRPQAAWDDPALPFAFGLQAIAWLPAFVTLHIYREAVRRHELQQVFARLVADAVPPIVAHDFLRYTSWRWTYRRAVDFLLSFAGLVPIAGMLAVPVAFVRTRGALALHEDNELLVPRRSVAPPLK